MLKPSSAILRSWLQACAFRRHAGKSHRDQSAQLLFFPPPVLEQRHRSCGSCEAKPTKMPLMRRRRHRLMNRMNLEWFERAHVPDQMVGDIGNCFSTSRVDRNTTEAERVRHDRIHASIA
jgi:hypothetical protein